MSSGESGIGAGCSREGGLPGPRFPAGSGSCGGRGSAPVTFSQVSTDAVRDVPGGADRKIPVPVAGRSDHERHGYGYSYPHLLSQGIGWYGTVARSRNSSGQQDLD